MHRLISVLAVLPVLALADSIPVAPDSNEWSHVRFQSSTIPDCDSGKILYDDATHAFSCGTDANTGPVLLRVTADVNNSTVNFADVTGLTTAVSANTTYAFHCVLGYTSAASTTAVQVSVNGPNTTELDYGVMVSVNSVTMFNTTQTAWDTSGNPGNSPASTRMPIWMSGTFIVDSSPGTFAVRVRSEVAASQVTIKKGSWCEVFQL